MNARFHLHHVRVLAGRGRSYDEVLRGLGVLAARYVHSIPTERAVLGISWGTAVHSTVRALHPDRALPVTVVQMVDAVGE